MNTSNDGARSAPLDAHPHQLGAHPLAGIAPEDFPRAEHGPERVARWYLNHGLQVFPVCAPVGETSCTGASLNTHAAEHKRGKLPVRKWGGARGIAPMTDAEVNDAWRRRAHNVALPMGRNGGAYTVALDFDGPEGERTREAAELALGPLPATLVNTTGRGRHLLFAPPLDAAPDDVASVKGSLASVRLDAARKVLVTAREGEPSAFDLRADGGYIVAPGSRHASGAAYRAEGAPIAPLPRAWWEALPRRGERPGPKRAPPPPLASGEADAFARVEALTSSAEVSPERARRVLAVALEAEAGKIAAAPDGARNDTLNASALRCFRLALAARVPLGPIGEELAAAAERAGLTAGETRDTLTSSRASAEEQGPAVIADRPRPASRRRVEGAAATDGAEHEAAGQGEGVPLPPDDGRPRIIVGPDLHRVVGEAVAALGAHPEVYQRRGVGLVRILSAPPDWPDPGAPVIDPLPRAVLAPVLSEVAVWAGRTRKGELRQVQPPDTVTAAVHASGVYPSTVRPLRGIVEAPTLRRDGELVTARGYDAVTGLFVHWPGAELDVPARPSRADARAAFGRLAELFADFRFAGDLAAQNIARAGVVAAMLSPLAREAVDGPCPAFVFEADGPNAGKTLAASVCGALVTGRVPAVRQHTADDDETAKRIASIAIAGHPVALFDNVRAHVEGGALEAALSAHSTIAARILGRSEDRELPWRTVLFLTMNAASYSADVARRVVHIAMRGRAVDLDAPAEHFTINDLARHVLGARAALLRDAFTILRAHHLAGRPMPGATLPTFEAWSRVVAAAVCWASDFDPVRARPPESANRDHDVARRVALTWCAAFPDGEAIRVGKALELVRGASSDRPGAAGPARADALAALRDALADLAGASDPGRITPGSLGKLLSNRVAGRVFVDPGNPARRVSVEAAELEHGSMRYRGRVETPDTETPVIPSGHPDDDHPERGGYGDTGGYSKRREEETQTAEGPHGAAVTWHA